MNESWTLEKIHTAIIFFVFTASGSFAQHIDTVVIRNQLQLIRHRDQITRTDADSAKSMTAYDSLNLVEVEKLIQQYGWLGKSIAGSEGNRTLFLVIQHSDLFTQQKYLHLFTQSVEVGESNPADLALLQDRILMREGKRQLYGSQVVRDSIGGWKFYPIEDEKNIDIRRAKVGLQPLEEYATYFGIDYTLPKKE